MSSGNKSRSAKSIKDVSKESLNIRSKQMHLYREDASILATSLRAVKSVVWFALF